MRKIYLLDILAHIDNKENTFGDMNYYANVYLTLEEAINEGKKWIKGAIQEFYYEDDYDYGNEEQYEYTTIEELQKMMKDLHLGYKFWVKERDLEYADTFKLPKTEEECKGLEPTTTLYYFDLEGNLSEKYLEYESKSDSKIFSFIDKE